MKPVPLSVCFFKIRAAQIEACGPKSEFYNFYKLSMVGIVTQEVCH